MKKAKILLLLLLIFIITGCTVDMSNDKKDEEKSNSSEIENDPPVVEKMENKGVESSIDNPLNIEQIGIASKYNAVLDTYQDVDVEIVQIFDNVDELINDYNLKNSEKKIEAKNGYKFVALEYEVTLVNFETESFGTDVSLDIEVLDENGKSFIVDDIKQVISVDNLKESFGITNNESGSVVIAFQIPKTVASYLIKIGTINHTIAYYKM